MVPLELYHLATAITMRLREIEEKTESKFLFKLVSVVHKEIIGKMKNSAGSGIDGISLPAQRQHQSYQS